MVTSKIMNLRAPQQMLMLSEGLNVFRVPVGPQLANKHLKSIRIREDTGCSVVAVKQKGELMINPDPAIILEKDDELVLIGTALSEKSFMEKYPIAEGKG